MHAGMPVMSKLPKCPGHISCARSIKLFKLRRLSLERKSRTSKMVDLLVNVPPSSSIRTTEARGNARMLACNIQHQTNL